MWMEVEIEGDGVLGLDCRGELTARDFEDIHSWLDAKLAQGGKLALVLFMGAFDGYADPAALWADIKVDTRHAEDLSRVAMVADQGWIKWGTKAVDFVFGTDLKWFHPSDRQAAIVWARGDA